MRFYKTNRRLHVGDGFAEMRPVGGEPVIDRKPGEPGFAQRSEQRLHIEFLVAADPAAAVHDDRSGKRPASLRNGHVHPQRNIVRTSVLDLTTHGCRCEYEVHGKHQAAGPNPPQAPHLLSWMVRLVAPFQYVARHVVPEWAAEHPADRRESRWRLKVLQALLYTGISLLRR